MILIVTHKKDYTADFIIDKLNVKHIPYFRLNCEDLLSNPEYIINNNSKFECILKDADHIKSVWLRRTQSPDVNLSPHESFYFHNEFKSLLDNIFCSFEDKKWLSNPFFINRAENKVLQLKLAADLGFHTPKTLITNSKKNLIDFFNSNLKTIIKPLHSGYVPHNGGEKIFFTSILTKTNIDSLNAFDISPCIYQEYIEKKYELRITVVDNQIFAAKIDSQKDLESKIDWRRSKQIFEPYQLPNELKEKCIALCSRLNLKFGAIDIIKCHSGKYVFLEINPNGQWAWIEMETGLPISDAIISYLNN